MFYTHINFPRFILFKNQTEDFLVGSGAQTQEKRLFVICELPQIHYKRIREIICKKWNKFT